MSKDELKIVELVSQNNENKEGGSKMAINILLEREYSKISLIENFLQLSLNHLNKELT